MLLFSPRPGHGVSMSTPGRHSKACRGFSFVISERLSTSLEMYEGYTAPTSLGSKSPEKVEAHPPLIPAPVCSQQDVWICVTVTFSGVWEAPDPFLEKHIQSEWA